MCLFQRFSMAIQRQQIHEPASAWEGLWSIYIMRPGDTCKWNMVGPTLRFYSRNWPLWFEAVGCWGPGGHPVLLGERSHAVTSKRSFDEYADRTPQRESYAWTIDVYFYGVNNERGVWIQNVRRKCMKPVKRRIEVGRFCEVVGVSHSVSFCPRLPTIRSRFAPR